jgi:hypothetical protein
MFPSPTASAAAGGRYARGGGDGGDTNAIAETAAKEAAARVRAWQKVDARGGVMGSAPGDNRAHAYEAGMPVAELTELGHQLLGSTFLEH